MSGPSREYSESGTPILRYEPREQPTEFAVGDDALIDAVSRHIELHIGAIEMVYHEIISDLVHIDILHVAPTPQRNHHTLITCGMSAKPMNVPQEVIAAGYDARRAELMLCLPPAWPMAHSEFENENNYWPIRWLKQLARLPHEYNSWLGMGHTIPNGEKADPFASNTKMGCWILLPPQTVPEDFATLKLDDRLVNFYGAVALHKAEMERKLKKGSDSLFDALATQGVNELLRPDRESTVKKPRWLF